jgi:photosystem II stability/assembly factor-like uncharacterized protein
LNRRIIAFTALVPLLAACSAGVDMSQVQAEAQKPVKRYEIIQAMASNGDLVVGGTQAGGIVSTTGSGKEWQREDLGPVSIIGMATCPDGSFVAIDFYHKVWSAPKTGKGWKSTPLEKPRVPLAVSCDSAGRWWVVGSGAKIAHSVDQGKIWAVNALDEDVQFTTVQMVNDKFGVVMGEFGMVVTTNDGGATWTKQAPIANEFYPYAALFTSTTEGWTSGLAGQILHTRDGARTWTKDENTTGAALYRLFVHEGKPYGVGANGIVARYDGKAWVSVAYADAIPVFLGAGAPVNERQLAIGGPGGLARVVTTHKN